MTLPSSIENKGTEAHHRTCPVCGSDAIAGLQGYERHQLDQCNSCGFVFMRRIPSAHELDDYYRNYGQTEFLSSVTKLSYNKLLDEFERYRLNNKILDVGCGAGWFLETAKERGWDVYGTEYAEDAVELCRRKGIETKHGALDASVFGNMRFDVITSFEVIEHLSKPLDELQHVHRLLRPNGLFYVTTPNFNAIPRLMLKADYSIIDYPEHLSYFTPRTLHRVLQSTGFRKKKMLVTGVSFLRMVKAKTPSPVYIGQNTSDEILRRAMSRNRVLTWVKTLANTMLTLTGTGITLKGYYEKK